MAAAEGPGEEDPEATLRALGPLCRPLSEAELAKRRRIHEEGGFLTPDMIHLAMWELAGFPGRDQTDQEEVR